MTAMRRAVLAAYPPSFKERYGDELAVLCEDHGDSPWATADLARGALRAWVRPVLSGSAPDVVRSRLLATVSVVWVCWCVVVVGTVATLRLLEDPAAPGLDVHTPGWVAMGELVAAAIASGAVLIVVGGSALGLRALRFSSEVRRLMTGPLLLLLPVVGGFLLLVLMAVRTPVRPGHVTPGFALLGLVWTIVVATAAVWWTVAVPRALRASSPAVRSLRLPTFAAIVVALLLVAPAALLVSVAVATGMAWGPVPTVITTSCTAVVVAAAVVALVSAGRGWAALRTVPARG